MLSSLLLNRRRQTDSYICFSTNSGTDNITISAPHNWDGTMYYSTNGQSWAEWDGTEITGTTIYIKGRDNTVVTNTTDLDNASARWAITCDSGVSCDGDIEMLRGCTGTIPEMGTGCYGSMFFNNSCLVKAPILSATTLASYCYQCMFSNCTSITEAPALPATTLASHCYDCMFVNCTSITEAPALPATTLADYCYRCMFSGASITEAPALPATTLSYGCYYGMFAGSRIVEPSALPADTLVAYCYANMFSYCTSLAAFPALNAHTLANKCYEYMFVDCALLDLSTIQNETYPNQLCLFPATTASDWGTCMFHGITGGTDLFNGSSFGSPSSGVQYYTSCRVIS